MTNDDQYSANKDLSINATNDEENFNYFITMDELIDGHEINSNINSVNSDENNNNNNNLDSDTVRNGGTP